MKVLIPTTQYKKDLKRYVHEKKKMESLKKLLRFLQEEQLMPQEYQPHQLHGKYKGCIECHIENDFLLIWINGDAIVLVRLGSHSELF